MAFNALHNILQTNIDELHFYKMTDNFRAILMLEYGLLSSPVNFHIKILLVRMYLEVGLVVAADHIFTLLDVKHLQLDSLGYLYAPLLAPLGNLPLAATTLEATAKFFISNYKDVCITCAIFICRCRESGESTCGLSLVNCSFF